MVETPPGIICGVVETDMSVCVCLCVRVPVVLASPSSLFLRRFIFLALTHVSLSLSGGICADWSSFCAQANGLLLFWKRSRRHAVLLRVAEDETEEERERGSGGGKPQKEVGWVGRKKKMGYAAFALRYTARWKSIRMVIKEWQGCLKESAAVQRDGRVWSLKRCFSGSRISSGGFGEGFVPAVWN